MRETKSAVDSEEEKQEEEEEEEDVLHFFSRGTGLTG